jgi:hypothetical protein
MGFGRCFEKGRRADQRGQESENQKSFERFHDSLP